MLKKLLMGTAAMAISASFTTGASALLIDSFTDAPQAIEIDGPLDGPPDQLSDNHLGPAGADDATIPGDGTAAPVVVELLDNAGGDVAGDLGPHASIIGGYRDVQTTLIQSPDSQSSTASDTTFAGGLFRHTQEVGVYSHSVITWNGTDGDDEDSLADGLGGADFTDGGTSSQFHIVVTLADLGIEWVIELFDGANTDSFAFVSPDNITTPTDFYLPFSNWAVDFTSIDSMIFTANNTDIGSVDTAVDLIETVGIIPEPASLTLLGAGLMGMGYFGKRRKA